MPEPGVHFGFGIIIIIVVVMIDIVGGLVVLRFQMIEEAGRDLGIRGPRGFDVDHLDHLFYVIQRIIWGPVVYALGSDRYGAPAVAVGIIAPGVIGILRIV
jgi:hypothetical protein